MGVLIDILFYSIGNIFMGVFLTILGITLMFVLIKLWYNNGGFNIISLIVGAFLFLFLSFQSILLCGAFSIKSYADDLELMINDIVATMPPSDDLSKEDSQFVLDKLVEERPLIGNFFNISDIHGHTSKTIGPVMMGELNSTVNSYILRRVLWSLLFIIVSVILIIKTMDVSKRSRYSKSGSYREYRYSGGHSGRRRRYEY